MKKYGLVGKTLSHSYSKEIHRLFGDYSYDMIETDDISDAVKLLRSGVYGGLNITVPYKKEIVPFCDALTEKAEKCGAVNTLFCGEDGKIYGDDTDYDGFLYMLERAGISPGKKKILILGSGGAAYTAKAVCEDMRASEITLVSRSGKNNYQNLYLHKDAEIIINATPVGMYLDMEKTPVSLDIFDNLYAVCDMIYNPLKTNLLLCAEKKGAKIANALDMLICQAARSAQKWGVYSFRETALANICDKFTRDTQNIVLIGMPGCGKTVCGEKISRLLGREFFDTDILIKEKYGDSAENIIIKHGEKYFRELEKEVVASVSAYHSKVVSLGGGALTDEENANKLKKNGVFYFLKRDISLLDKSSRPLSDTDKKLKDLYEKRIDLYEKYADYTVNNDISPQKTAENIIKTHYSSDLRNIFNVK